MVEAARMTLDAHIAELDRLKAAAEADNQMSTAVRAEELRGKALGYYIDRRQSVNASPLDDMDIAELLKLRKALQEAVEREQAGRDLEAEAALPVGRVIN